MATFFRGVWGSDRSLVPAQDSENSLSYLLDRIRGSGHTIVFGAAKFAIFTAIDSQVPTFQKINVNNCLTPKTLVGNAFGASDECVKMARAITEMASKYAQKEYLVFIADSFDPITPKYNHFNDWWTSPDAYMKRLISYSLPIPVIRCVRNTSLFEETCILQADLASMNGYGVSFVDGEIWTYVCVENARAEYEAMSGCVCNQLLRQTRRKRSRLLDLVANATGSVYIVSVLKEKHILPRVHFAHLCKLIGYFITDSQASVYGAINNPPASDDDLTYD